MYNKRILVTGGAGYIGDAVVHFLLTKASTSPLVLDNLSYGGAYMRPIKFVRADITDYIKMEEMFSDGDGFDAVVHLAAIVGDGACAVDEARTIEVNENATKNIADLCKRTNTRMIFASTCSVYGSNNEVLNENSATNPLSLYAGTKLNAEQYIKDTVDDYVIFRLGTLFGMSTPHARIRCDLVANILTYKAALGQTLTVFGGSQWRPLLHVKDAAVAFSNAATGRFKKGTYILSRENITIADLADLIVDEVGQGDVEKTESKFEDLRNYKVDNSKSKSQHYYSCFGLRSGIAQMAEIMRDGRIADIWSSQFHNAKFAIENHV